MARAIGDQVGQHVNNRIAYLTHIGNQPIYAALMARLRRGVGKKPGSMPELWDLMFENLPVSLVGSGPNPSPSECAIHAALTLFAIHQQSKDIQENSMHNSGVPLGVAVRRLIQSKQEREEAIKRRFMTVVTADSLEELVWHLRGLVQLLRDMEVPMDYAGLAKNLYHFQFPDLRDKVRLEWGRQLYFESN